MSVMKNNINPLKIKTMEIILSWGMNKKVPFYTYAVYVCKPNKLQRLRKSTNKKFEMFLEMLTHTQAYKMGQVRPPINLPFSLN